MNNSERILFTGKSTDIDVYNIFYEVIIPISYLSPLFSIFPIFPLELLNNPL